LAAMPNPGEAPPQKARRRKARAQGTDIQTRDCQSPVRIEYLQGMAALEVWA
jgi:hypothetical protein